MREITKSGPLLDGQGNLADYGWARQPLLDANLEVRTVMAKGRLLMKSGKLLAKGMFQ